MDTVPKFPAIPPDAAKEFEGKSVVVIGAGVCGLFAANALQFMGVEDFTVLEASPIFGGRIKMVEDFHEEVPLDLGAEWIHASTGQVTRDMLVFEEEKSKLEDAEFMPYQPEWWFRGTRSKFVSWLYQETKWRRSTWWHYLDKHVHSRVMGKVICSNPVQLVRASGEQLEVVTPNGVVHADKVICTLSVNMLKRSVTGGGDPKSTLRFEPELSEKKRLAIESLDMCSGFRILFEMSEKFYPDVTVDNGMMTQLFNLDDLAIFYDPLLGKDGLSGTQHIMAFVAVGEKATGPYTPFESSNEELVEKVLKRADELFQGKASRCCVKKKVQNWCREKFVGGAYSCSSSKDKHRTELRVPEMDGRLLFAGEASSAKYYGLAPSAALEGRLAAVEAVTGKKLR